MFEAQLLIRGSSALTIYSPWFPRQGDSLRATLEVVAIAGTGTSINVEVFTKNSEDAGDGTDAAAGTDINRTSAGRETVEWLKSLEELVRYKYTVDSTNDPAAWVLFRMLPPVWFDSVKA